MGPWALAGGGGAGTERRMPRVLFFMNSSSPLGGVETWLDRIRANLSKNGFEPIVGLVRGLRYNLPDRYRAHHPELETFEIDGRGLNREGRVRALMRCIRALRPDVALPMGIVEANEAVIRCKQRGQAVRLVAHAQGNLPPMLADLRLYRDWFDRVVCPGRLTRRFLVEFAGFAPERVVHIANGADTPLADRLPRRPGAPLRLGYIGRLSQPDKRVLDLIPLCRELERLGVDFELHVVGCGACRGELEEGLENWGNRVRLHGALPHEEIYRRIFPNLDALILTSASEAFGIVLVEAMMHGVVPVTSRYYGFHSEGLVKDGETGLSFEVGDMEAAALAVQRLERGSALLQELSAHAQEHGRLYTWQRSLDAWQAELADLSKEPVVQASTLPIAPVANPRGRLERLGVPDGLIDGLRRLRRATLGAAVPPGGEEWPLFHRGHSADTVADIQSALLTLESSTENEFMAREGKSNFMTAGQ
ncbi:MAG: glycosyltransferase [Xanthomonadales bacterium PRO6]|nr:glycosyltransferase [Xanthomonadales bacterium PRO6]